MCRCEKMFQREHFELAKRFGARYLDRSGIWENLVPTSNFDRLKEELSRQLHGACRWVDALYKKPFCKLCPPEDRLRVFEAGEGEYKTFVEFPYDIHELTPIVTLTEGKEKEYCEDFITRIFSRLRKELIAGLCRKDWPWEYEAKELKRIFSACVPVINTLEQLKKKPEYDRSPSCFKLEPILLCDIHYPDRGKLEEDCKEKTIHWLKEFGGLSIDPPDLVISFKAERIFEAKTNVAVPAQLV